MYPKVRNPVETWLLTVGTGGIYAALWVWEVGSEINNAENSNIFRVHLWRFLTILSFLLCLVAIAVAVRSGNPAPAFIAIGLWGTLLAYVQVQVGNYIKSKEQELGLPVTFSNAKSLLLMYLVGMSGMAYIQSNMNRIIESENWPS